MKDLTRMKWLIIILVFTGLSIVSKAQNKEIDDSLVINWSIPSNVKITDNEKYVIFNKSRKSFNRICVETLDNSWKVSFNNISDSKYYIGSSDFVVFQKTFDTVGILNLLNKSILYRGNAQDLSAPEKSTFNWFTWKTEKGNLKIFKLYNATIDKVFDLGDGVIESLVDPLGSRIFIICKAIDGFSIKSITLLKNKYKVDIVWKGKQTPINLTFNEKATGLIFFSQDSATCEVNILKYDSSGKLITKKVDITQNLGSLYNLSHVTNASFNDKCDKLFFNVIKQKVTEKPKSSFNPTIWRYDSPYIPAMYGNVTPPSIMLLDLINYRSKVFQLDEGETFKDFDCNHRYQLVLKSKQDPNGEQFLQNGGMKDLYLLDINSGEKKEIIKDAFILSPTLSPNEELVIYGNRKDGNIYHYNLKSGTNFHLSTLPFENFMIDKFPNFYKLRELPNFGKILGWIGNSDNYLISDGYDLWKICPKDLKRSENITKGYGLTHKIEFSIVQLDNFRGINIFLDGDTIFLRGEDKEHKKGLFKLKIGQAEYPTCLFFKGCNFSISSQILSNYLVNFETAVDNNWWITKNFLTFRQVTFEKPYLGYNWYSPLMYHWNDSKGKLHDGIIYKPQDFDSSKSYPIIIRIYLSMTHRLYEQATPDWSNAEVNIPWFVSRGYLVFEPDIQVSQAGDIGPNALNTISSLVESFKPLSWIDKQKIGLSGASFGGYEINYLITHSNLFRAAAPSCATVDLVSSYNSLRGWPLGREGGNQANYEYGIMRTGETLWKDPNSYINNSPIFKANDVKIPVLIMHNMQDGNVSAQQGIEWFMALRRLGKRAWMLQYENEGHGLFIDSNRRDYNTRLENFFNYYLKGHSKAAWMNN